jgi:hypothetical protein
MHCYNRWSSFVDIIDFSMVYQLLLMLTMLTSTLFEVGN